MNASTMGFIGLGLMGGSIARAIKREKPEIVLMAYERNSSTLRKAKEEQIIDTGLEKIDENLSKCDLVFLCTPVEYNARYLSDIKPFIKPGAIITDVGSTKADIHKEVSRLHMDGCFIGGHPMAGSEKTGYESSTDHLLENAYYVITPTEESSPQAIGELTSLVEMMGSIPIVLDCRRHDRIAAAISHLPHVIASSLVGLISESDGDDGLMKRLAAGGFKDITRIASSSPEMWEQICMTNREPLVEILKLFIDSLSQTLDRLESGDAPYLTRLFEASRDYRNAISDKSPGSIAPECSFTVNMADEIGAISTLSVILAAKGVSIKNIGINHNREQGEGALKIAFYDRKSMEMAWKQLERYHYDLIP